MEGKTERQSFLQRRHTHTHTVGARCSIGALNTRTILIGTNGSTQKGKQREPNWSNFAQNGVCVFLRQRKRSV